MILPTSPDVNGRSKTRKEMGMRETPYTDRRKRTRAFTLVEMLAVVVIIFILTVGIVMVGRMVKKKMQINATEGRIQIIVSALEQYRDSEGTSGDFDFPAGNGNIANALGMMYEVPLCKKILAQIPEDFAEDRDMDGVIDTIYDSWGKDAPIEYYHRGKGNFPTIQSAGPDRDFKTADDILSDRL